MERSARGTFCRGASWGIVEGVGLLYREEAVRVGGGLVAMSSLLPTVADCRPIDKYSFTPHCISKESMLK